MYVKTITYTDYNGVERTEDFMFHLSEAEVFELQYSKDGGLDKQLDRMTKAKDQVKLVKFFKDLVLKAYGEKSDDGRRFVKSEEISEAFSQTEAYSQIFMELATNVDSAQAFVDGLVPKNLKAQYDAMKAENTVALPIHQ